MKVLTLRQPWAGLLVLGIKQMETRSWNTKYRGRLYIHASASMSREELRLLMRLWTLLELSPQQINTCHVVGAIIGHVDIIETYSTNDEKQTREISMIEAMLGDYSPDRFFWKCELPTLLPKPIPAKGQLGFWNWEGAITP